MSDQPSPSVLDALFGFVHLGVKVFLNSASHASMIVPGQLNAAISAGPRDPHVCVVKHDFGSRREKRKPSLDFPDGVLVIVAGVDEEEIDGRRDVSYSAKVMKARGKCNIVASKEMPPRVV